jgi:hypothetical protein
LIAFVRVRFTYFIARERFDIEHIDHYRFRAKLGKRGGPVLQPRSTDNRMPGPT